MKENVEVTKAPEVSFTDVHPTRTAGGNSGVSSQEPDFIHCKQCGFLLDRNKVSKGSGWGNETTVAITTLSGSTANAVDPTVGPGCPFCGTSEYE